MVRHRVWTSTTALIALLVTAPVAEAQDRGTVTGQVTEALSGRALTGAQVSIPGSGLGMLTAANGRYLILNVPAGTQTIEVQIIGYKTMTATVEVRGGQTTTHDFGMSQTAIQLNEIVVTGAGVTTERRKLGNTVATINTQSLQNQPIRTVSEMLSAREPGVVALPTDGMAGSGARVRIRGSSSLSQLNQPVIYVDGVRVTNIGDFAPGVGAGGGGRPSRLDDLNPEAIERIEVLKGAAAATLFGTEASGGVIQIFTKRGSAMPMRYDLQIERGFTDYPSGAYAPNAGFARSQGQADSLSTHWGRSIKPFEVFEVPLIPELYETGATTTTALSVSGGSPLMTYYLSGRYNTEDGPFGGNFWGPVKDSNDKKQANVNLTIAPMDGLSIRINTMYTEGHQEVPENNNNIYGTISSAIMAKPELANCRLSAVESPGRCTGAGNAWGNPSFITTRESLQRITRDEVSRYAGSLGATYQLEGVTLKSTVGIDMLNQQSFKLIPFSYNLDRFTGNNTRGLRTASDRNRREITVDFNGSNESTVGEAWGFETTLGAQGFFTNQKASGGTGQEFPSEGVEVVSAGAVLTGFESFVSTAQLGLFAQEQVSYRDYLFLTGGVRYDKHSAFGETSAGIWYPKVSLSFVPATAFGWDPSMISSFRLRAAVGKSGRQPDAFAKFTTYGPLAGETGAGVAPGNLGDKDIKPEVSTEFEFGGDVGLFDDRLGLDVTYWNRTVSDLLVERQFAPSGGFRARQLSNIGEMNAYGVEMSARGVAYTAPNLSVNLFASAAYLHEEITDMGGAPSLKSGGSYTRYRNFIKEGYAPGAFFGPKLIDHATPLDQTGDCKVDTEAELLAYFASPRNPSALNILVQGGDPRAACNPSANDFLNHYLGKPTPDWTGTFGGEVRFFNNFVVSSLFEYKLGEYFVHDLTGAFRRSNPSIGRNIAQAARAEATMLNPASTAQQRLDAAVEWATEIAALSPYDGLNEIFEADFMRWREAAITWQAPVQLAERISASSLSFTAAGRNLAIWTKYPGADPEMNAIGLGSDGSVDNNFLDGTAAFGVPIPRRFTFSTRITF